MTIHFILTMTEPNFRLSAKHLFLTYPKCTLTPENVLEKLTVAIQPYEIVEYIVARELHEDGTPHIHAYLQLDRKCNIRGATQLDVSDDAENTFHGNYQPCRNPTFTKRYVRKAGDYITNEQLFQEKVSKCKSRAEVLELCATDNRVREYRFWQEYFIYKKTQSIALPELRELRWYNDVPPIQAGKAIYVYGPPGCGKTSYITWKAPNAFRVNSPKHFQHYDFEDCIHLQDFRGEDWRTELTFLRSLITDPICLTPAYYGSRRLVWPRYVYIDSNEHSTVLTTTDPAFIRRLETYSVNEQLDLNSE